MTRRIALCIDELTYRTPELVGFEGESLEKQAWIDAFATGVEARRAIRNDGGFREAWVISSEDVDPINLAATIKSDNPDMPVKLVANSGSGSLFSRAHSAGIDSVLDYDSFLKCYYETKGSLVDDLPEPAAIEVADPPLAEAVQETALAKLQVERIHPRTLVAPVTSVPQTAKRSRGFIMPIVSGSGGAGKSSVAVLSALIARSMGYRTLLLDYDLQFGDVALMAGIDDPLAIDCAISHRERLAQEAARDSMLTVLAAPERLEQSEEVIGAMPQFLDEIAGDFDAIIANTGAAWAEQHAVLLERSYVSLFLIDQRSSSIRACKHALELCARCGIATGPIEFALNRCAKGAPLTAADVSSALKGATVYELKDGGRDVEDYLGSGAAVDLIESGNDFSESLRQVIGKLLPGGTVQPADRTDEPEGGLLARRRGRHAGRKRGRRS